MKYFKCFLFLFAILTSLFQPVGLKAQSIAPEIVHKVILIGDAGRLLNGKSLVPDAIARHINPADSAVTIVFLGDNVYSKGLPGAEENHYEESVEILSKQLLPFENYKANVYIIPGNHDWQKSGPLGWERIRRQADWIDSLKKKNIVFLPKDGCPGPEEISLSDSLVLVIVDTQWWLHPYEKPGIQDDCDCKTEDQVIAKLKNIAYRNRTKRIIVATHHPMRSNGIHGGYYTWKQHLFPFTEFSRNLYIPLPVLGSIYPIVRGKFGNVQDLQHPEYRNMTRRIEEAMSMAPDVIYAAGHDHALQLIQEGKQSYIVSGSGINRERVNNSKDAPFVSDQRGYVELQYRSDGSEQLVFHEVDEQSNDTEAFVSILPFKSRQAIYEAQELSSPFIDSITVAIAPQYDKVSGFHRLWFGKNYRKQWATPVTFKVFHLQQEGLKILGQGGGQQTKSLRMADASGKEWVLRGVQKDPAKALPEKLRATVARNIVQDQISAAQPYAPLTVPLLAEALNVPHANPRLVFVPNDTALGFYRKEFANTICILEEREPVSEGKIKTYNTLKVLEKLREDAGNNRIDEKAVLRARMLDLLIGDWDRHEDQWRWEKKEKGGKDIYSPIPRDRDQVYFINSGILPYIAARKWLSPKFQGFGEEIRDVNGFMYNARFFDRFFLHELSEEEWKKTIEEIQQTITNDLLSKAVKQLPDTIYAQCGEDILSALIARRDALLKKGMTYYKFLSKTVEIPGSSKNDFFEINYEKKALHLSVSKIKKDGTKGATYYERTFNRKKTKEIRLYGLGGEDIFQVNGAGRSAIKVRMIGGEDKDSFSIDRKIHNRYNLLVYDRSDKKNVFPGIFKATVHSSGKNSVNEYNGRTFKYNQLLPQGSAGYNVDDGVWLGVGAQYTKHGFRKEPYSQRHRFSIGHALATDATNIRYYGHFVKLIGNNDLKINFDARAPDNVSNFFGKGNETLYEKHTEFNSPITYYRTRYNFITAQVKLEHKFGKTFKIYGGVIAQFYSIDSSDNTGRYITVFNAQNPQEEVYERKLFTGLIGGFQVDTRDNDLIPIRGIFWNTHYSGLLEMDERGRKLGQLESDMTIYTSFHRDPRLVIINKIGGGLNVGNPYFFQLSYLGGSTNLQGFRNYRFAGNSKLYHNIELRFKLFDFASYLIPGSVGLIAFNNVGRVWAKNENSEKWHDGYGGGFYIVPAQMLVINMTLGFSREGVLPYISVGVKL